MKLNCKAGDLAVVVKSYAGNEGKIVRCLKLIPQYRYRINKEVFSSPAWEVDTFLPNMDGKLANIVLDFQLKPLRDSDEDDETLTWAGKPNKIKTKEPKHA